MMEGKIHMDESSWKNIAVSPEDPLATGILFTDQYQLTMAQLYYRMGLKETMAQFDHFFRSYPDYGNHQAGYCINCGLSWFLGWMRDLRFTDREIEKLRSQRSRIGNPLFAEDFLAWLKKEGNFESIGMWAIPEGRVVHPGEPLTTVTGMLPMAQILETALLNQLNYQILIATKASRIRQAGGGRLVLEFGVRRGQDRGANAGARAALIGGADFSSNTGISHLLGLPPRGTHAHSMVQAFMALGEGELGAFRAYAEVYPDDCLLLVDTIDTLESGVPNAIRVFEELERKGHEPTGIRLDSGDLAHLSVRSAKMLDQAGFSRAKIVLSNQLDEQVLTQIISQIREEAPQYGVDSDALMDRLMFGVGTRLITSAGDSALDGIYKLVAVEKNGRMIPTIKISETPAKIPNPGDKQVWRLYDRRCKATADLICLKKEDPRSSSEILLHHPVRSQTMRRLQSADLEEIEPLLVEVLREGHPLVTLPDIGELRALRDRDLEHLDSGVRRLVNPHNYHVSLSDKLWRLKQKLIDEAH
jgi:nicotinate phosphoribosyltransferase